MESIPTDNARLTAAIRDGSREAFDEMCGRYYAPLMAYARLFLKGNWAQDIVQVTVTFAAAVSPLMAGVWI